MRLIDVDGSFTINASDNTGYSLAFGGGIISCVDEFGHIEAEFLTDDIQAVDAVPLSDLLPLRDWLYAHDAITMEGLRKLNTLIGKYKTVHEGRGCP